jgi:hypothetical protein
MVDATVSFSAIPAIRIPDHLSQPNQTPQTNLHAALVPAFRAETCRRALDPGPATSLPVLHPLAELNAAIRSLVLRLNTKPFRKRLGSRAEVFATQPEAG